MKKAGRKELWFVTGSQHLYGADVLRKVAGDSMQIAGHFNKSEIIPCNVVFKPVVKTADEITSVCAMANNDPACTGLVFWMHTFSPAKMWIQGLSALRKPFLHLHTQFNRDIPWDSIDMDFMNLNQSAHGDREFGFICSRLRLEREVIAGHWEDESVLKRIGAWARAALAWSDWQGMKVARFGDNMRDVAVTEGDKLEAQKKFGFSVNGYGVGDLVKVIEQTSDAEVDMLLSVYKDEYEIKINEKQKQAVRASARIEAGMRNFLENGGFSAFTTTFEDLTGLAQLPGLPVQRLMAEGYGFGAEGDWKTAALVRAVKVMGEGIEGGTSFMEDYTYHLDPAGMMVLGAHMLEVCPSIAAGKAKLEVHPLDIGGRENPARLVFNASAGPAVNVSLIDMGNRFRMIVNEVEAVEPKHDLPKLPVARVFWVPQPDLEIGATAWILAGGAHHTAYSQQADTKHIELFCEMAGIELVVIDRNTSLSDLKKELRWNETAYV